MALRSRARDQFTAESFTYLQSSGRSSWTVIQRGRRISGEKRSRRQPTSLLGEHLDIPTIALVKRHRHPTRPASFLPVGDSILANTSVPRLNSTSWTTGLLTIDFVEVEPYMSGESVFFPAHGLLSSISGVGMDTAPKFPLRLRLSHHPKSSSKPPRAPGWSALHTRCRPRNDLEARERPARAVDEQIDGGRDANGLPCLVPVPRETRRTC
ncbi:hypothetical protein B0H13DRAFT_2269398 [Mycena leptocephala]|nr:hypothetical protein B0H13DRAFT_2269398 [Mycena leptocephala]